MACCANGTQAVLWPYERMMLFTGVLGMEGDL